MDITALCGCVGPITCVLHVQTWKKVKPKYSRLIWSCFHKIQTGQAKIPSILPLRNVTLSEVRKVLAAALHEPLTLQRALSPLPFWDSLWRVFKLIPLWINLWSLLQAARALVTLAVLQIARTVLYVRRESWNAEKQSLCHHVPSFHFERRFAPHVKLSRKVRDRNPGTRRWYPSPPKLR